MVTPYVNSPAEARAEAKRKRRGRRNAIVLIAIINVLVLVDGYSGASDLRRMATPQGAAAAWADAAAAGDCDTYVDLEGPGRLVSDLGGVALNPKATTQRAALCQRVTSAWVGASVQKSEVIGRGTDVAVVRLTVTIENSGPVTGEVLMHRISGRWRVALPVAPCVTPAYSPRDSLCPSVTLPGT